LRHHSFDLVSIRLFLAASHMGSFTRAARAMNLVTSAVSRRLTEMENELGAPLFVRHSGGVALTPQGLEVQRHFSSLIANYERTMLGLADLARGVRGLVRVWATSTSLTNEFSVVLKRFLDTNQALRVEIEERTDLQVVKAVEDGTADLGLCSSHQNTYGLDRTRLATDKIALVAPHGHALLTLKDLRFADIAEYELVGWDEGVALGALLQSHAVAADIPLKIRLQVRSLGAMCSMVKAGLGIGIAPHPRILGEARMFDLATAPIAEAWADREILLTFRDRLTLTPAATLLLDFLVEGLKAV
jgi:DNA-binding transcriptional LysR family regulator